MMEEVIKNCLEIIRELTTKLRTLESQNGALNAFLSIQTELLINYAYFYKGTADSFIPDVNFKILFDSAKKVKLDSDTLKLLELIKIKYKEAEE